MSATAVITRQHLLVLARRRTFVLMLGVLLLMTALSGVIGWSSHRTILRVYDETVRTLLAEGQQPPPNPFASKPRLELLNNMVIYVPLIGALLAIVVGHLGVMGDRQAGLTRLIFTRPLSRSAYFWGKLAGSAIAGTAIMAACWLLSVIAVALINRELPTGSEVVRLTLFFALSGLYLMLFVLIGCVAALLTRSQSMALFVAVAAWVLVTFATPQFTSGLRPIQSLNPVTDPVSKTSSPFFEATSKAEPIAVNEQYKALSEQLLAEGRRIDAGAAAGQLAPIVGFALLLAGWTHVLVRRQDVSEEGARD
jgi:ABC-type transport system involved in multi-copper enzyme maturation permease subunit